MLRVTIEDFVVILILVPSLFFLGWALLNLTREIERRARRH